MAEIRAIKGGKGTGTTPTRPKTCMWCGSEEDHPDYTCPRLKSVSFWDDFALKKVTFWEDLEEESEGPCEEVELPKLPEQD